MLELQVFWEYVQDHPLPAGAINEDGPYSLSELFERIEVIRHIAVHRQDEIPVTSLDKMLRNAIAIARAFRDEARLAELLKWHRSLSELLPNNYDIPRAERNIAGELDDVRDSITTIQGKIERLKKQLIEEKAREAACEFKLVSFIAEM
jgi:uncharacterized protein with von Willebrand factor type A (vWA) domain